MVATQLSQRGAALVICLLAVQRGAVAVLTGNVYKCVILQEKLREVQQTQVNDHNNVTCT